MGQIIDVDPMETPVGKDLVIAINQAVNKKDLLKDDSMENLVGRKVDDFFIQLNQGMDSGQDYMRAKEVAYAKVTEDLRI